MKEKNKQHLVFDRAPRPLTHSQLYSPPKSCVRTTDLYYRTVEDIETRRSALCRSVREYAAVHAQLVRAPRPRERRRRRCCVHACVSE